MGKKGDLARRLGELEARIAAVELGAVDAGGGRDAPLAEGEVPASPAGAWEPLAPSLAALGHPVRLTLLRAALDGQREVGALAAAAGVGTTGQLYHHLRELSATGWLQAERRGAWAVPEARVAPLLALLGAAEAADRAGR